MKPTLAAIAMGALIAAAMAPGAVAAAATPSAAVTKTGDCHTVTYSWANFKKAQRAEFRIHHFGIFETSRSTGGLGASGSYVMPSDVTFVAGDQYTVLGLLIDGSGRTIQNSGAVWYGVC